MNNDFKKVLHIYTLIRLTIEIKNTSLLCVIGAESKTHMKCTNIFCEKDMMHENDGLLDITSMI